MSATLNVNVRTDKDFTIITRHPKWEAIFAKQKCDEISNKEGVFNIDTVSTDATTVYWEYGKFVKNIDVHLFLDGKESELSYIFESYNESLSYMNNIITPEAYEKIDKYYKALEEKEEK